MATSQDEKAAFSLPVRQTLVPSNSPFALCFALTFYLLLIQRPNRPLALSIKLANGIIQATSAIHYLKSPSPSPATLFLASKALIKGLKYSQHLIPAGAADGLWHFPFAAGNLRACVAGVNLLRYTLHPPHANMPMGLGFLKSGHKFSKNLLRVLDAFVGLRMDAVVRRSVDALGLLFKAAVVVSVIGEWVGRNGWRRNRYVIWRVGDLRCGVRLWCKRSYFDRIGAEKRVSCFGVLDFGDCDVVRVEELGVSVSELLSLSIPIEEVDVPIILQKRQL